MLHIPHWYTSGDVLFFVRQGNTSFTMMNDEGKVYHTLIQSGDVIPIPVGNFRTQIPSAGEGADRSNLKNPCSN